MGWFSGAPAEPQKTADGGLVAPARNERAACYNGRDGFFKCLDKHGIIDSVKEDAKARKHCAKELAEFEVACKDSWVTYFKKKRVMEWQRDATIEKMRAEGTIGVPPAEAQK